MTATIAPAGQLVTDMTMDDYLATEALSSSGAKLLLPPSSPAMFRWRRDHPVHKDIFDFGAAAHKAVLRDGARQVVVIKADSWRTKAAQAARVQARLEGKIPLLEKRWEEVKVMAAEVLAHPTAAALLNPGYGQPEQTLLWRDQRRGIDCKARFDWLPSTSSGRLIVPDYKTAECAEPSEFARTAAANLRYYQQAAWYMDGAAAVFGLDPTQVAFVFIVQEKDPPYLVSLIELDDEAIRLGRFLNDYAAGIYADCVRTGQWPGYGSDVHLVSLPAWATKPWKSEL